MTIEKFDLKQVARLARLTLDDSELASLSKDLESIVGYVATLSEVDVQGIEPMSHVGSGAQQLREDCEGIPLGRACLTDSKGFEDGLVRVPKIIE